MQKKDYGHSNRPVTMKDIARYLNIDRTTVSKALSGNSDISEATVRKVMDAVEVLGYKKDVFARGLITRKNALLGLALTEISRGIYAPIVQGYQAVARKHGYGVIICDLEDTPDWSSNNIEQINSLKQQRVSGITFATSGTVHINRNYFDELRKTDIALNTIQSYVAHEGMDNIIFNHEKAGYELTEYLIKAGHKSIAFMTYSPDLRIYAATIERLEGYMRAMRDAGLQPLLLESCEYAVSYGDEVQLAYRFLSQIWSRMLKATALIGANDCFALGMAVYLREKGVKIPDDIAVAGFDDLFADMGIPPLTTMKIPAKRAGELAAEYIIGGIDSKNKVAVQTSLDYEMIIRQSTKAK